MISPAKIAWFFLKVNLIIFGLTLGLNTLAFFPYYMQVSQVANNIGIDIANKNFTTENEMDQYLARYYVPLGDKRSDMFTFQTFNEDDFDGVMTTQSASSGSYVNYQDAVGFVSQLKNVNGNTYVKKNNSGKTVASATVEFLDQPRAKSNGILRTGNTFDPVKNNNDLIGGFCGGNGVRKGNMVNRGEPFKVTVQTRYSLTGGAFGFMFTTTIPVTAETVGVTTKYYQIDQAGCR